jgi:hypothetical protein
MNSGETEFISEFMDLLFTKAASEEIYCELYARLLLELTGKFPHLRTEIKTIYENFLGIFVEARDIPDQSTADYKKFLDAQEKKKFRKGYSHFLAEIYNKGLITSEAIETAVNTIMASLDKLEKDTQYQTLMVHVSQYTRSLATTRTAYEYVAAMSMIAQKNFNFFVQQWWRALLAPRNIEDRLHSSKTSPDHHEPLGPHGLDC